MARLDLPDDTPSVSVSIECWEHTSLAVGDIGTSAAFYRAAFDYEVVFDARDVDLLGPCTGLDGVGGDLVHLRRPGESHVLELIAFAGVPPGREDDAPVRVGHGHIAFLTHRFDVALAAVSNLGATLVGEVVLFPEGRGAYLREPGGSIFELSEGVAGAGA